ncbi:MAG TPA: helix-turn-helix domain-containing protein [Flavisolibacter sp.]|jgi:AraC-like DNA-binding protein|nr:helix-turn-helix domain-containing protein [Flavisolibacter sp.]
MIYQKFKPADWLSPFVECYFIWHSSGKVVTDFVVESPPTGFCSIVFNSGDDYILQNKKYEQLAVPRQFISGQSIYSYKLFFNGVINLAGIVLKPAALASLFHHPTYQYTEERITLREVFKPSVVEKLSDQLAQVGDDNEKAKLLEGFLTIQCGQPQLDDIDRVANLIVERNGMIDVSELLKEVFMSRRNFERKFFKKVGLSPKYYARLRRISFVMNAIAGKKKADWSHLFSECEFYDQSHFIRDFVEFTGRTPQQYLDENLELANLVEKPRPDYIRY